MKNDEDVLTYTEKKVLLEEPKYSNDNCEI